jgi:hypothetical protein
MLTAAAIALIFLTIEALIVSFVVLAIVAGLVYGMHKFRGLLKRVLLQLQGLTYQIYGIVHGISDKIVAPFLWINATYAGVQAMVDSVKRRLSM